MPMLPPPPEASRRADRRRRHFRDRRRLSSAEALPGQELRDPRGAGRGSAGPGICSAIPASARIQRHVHAGLPVPALDGGQGDRRRRRRSAPMSRRRRGSSASTARIRFGHRVTQRRLVVGGGALDGRGRGGRRDAALHLRASCSSAAAITITSRATGPNGRARRDYRGPHRPSAVLAGGSRLSPARASS